MKKKLIFAVALLLALVLISPALSSADAQIDGFLDDLFSFLARGGSLIQRPHSQPVMHYDSGDFVSERYELSTNADVLYGYSVDGSYDSLSFSFPRSFAGSNRVFSLCLRYLYGMTQEDAEFLVDSLENSVLDGFSILDDGTRYVEYWQYGQKQEMAFIRHFTPPVFTDPKE